MEHILKLSRFHNSCKQNFPVTKWPKTVLFVQFHNTGTVLVYLLHNVNAGLVAVDLIVSDFVFSPAAPQTSENSCNWPFVVDNPGMIRQSLNELFLPVAP